MAPFFLYYLAAIGNPNIDVKLDILKHNLTSIYDSIQSQFDIMINCYDDTGPKIKEMLSSLSFLNNVIIHEKKGRLVELWYTNPHHELVQNYHYILYMLDDVKINNMDIYEFINIKNTYAIEFLSPKVIGGTWEYMRNQEDNVLAFANNIELFCLLLTPRDFYKFISINDVENNYTWGVDLLLGHFKIKSAICFSFCVSHMLYSTTDGGIAGGQMHDYIRKHGYQSVSQINEKYPPIYKTIFLS